MRHLLPNVAAPIIVVFSINIGAAEAQSQPVTRVRSRRARVTLSPTTNSLSTSLGGKPWQRRHRHHDTRCALAEHAEHRAA